MIMPPSVYDSGERFAFHQIVHGSRYQPILHMADAVVPKIIDQVAPGIVELLDPGDEGHHAADLELAIEHVPAAEQERRHALQVVTEVHQKIHGELELEDAHIELKDALDRPGVDALAAVVLGGLDDADAEPTQHLNARRRALDDRLLHQGHEHQLGHKDRDRDERHPEVEMDHVGQHGQHHA